MVDHDGNDQRQGLGVLALLAVEFPDFQQIPQELQTDELVRIAFVLEKKIDKPRPIVGQVHLVEQVGIVGCLLCIDKGVLGDGQRFELDVLQHSCGEVVGQKVGGNLLVTHGLPEERVVDVVEFAHGRGT